MANPLSAGSLTGKRALVTGSSRGIGADTAQYLADAGASVVINYRNKEARAVKLVDSIVEKGGTALAVGADLTDADLCRPDVPDGRRRLGRPRHPRAERLRAAWSRAWPRTTPCSSTATRRSTS